MKITHRIWWVATATTAVVTTTNAQFQTNPPINMDSDAPSDVPSYVPTYMPSASPSSLPTIAGGGGPGPYPPCPICPEGQVIENPDVVLPGGQGFTCLESDTAGRAGNIDPDSCTLLQSAGPGFCGCIEEAPPDSKPPTPTPTAATVPPPTPGECTTSTCAEVHSWAVLGSWINAAESGDTLCMCGRFYAAELCGDSITMAAEKDITLECVAGNVCSYACPLPAFIVNAGSLTLTGTEENIILSGGIQYSRIVVGAGGTLTAAQVVFEDTASVVGATSKRRHLQTSNGLGGGLATSGMTTLEDSRFDNCTASLSGGAVYVGGGSASIKRVKFRENNAFEGAGVFAQGGVTTITESLFEGNVVTNTNTDPDIFVRGGATVEACDNTADSDQLNTCSAPSTLWTATSMALAAGLAAALFA